MDVANIRNRAQNFYSGMGEKGIGLNFMPKKKYVSQNFYAADGGRANFAMGGDTDDEDEVIRMQSAARMRPAQRPVARLKLAQHPLRGRRLDLHQHLPAQQLERRRLHRESAPHPVVETGHQPRGPRRRRAAACRRLTPSGRGASSPRGPRISRCPEARRRARSPP